MLGSRDPIPELENLIAYGVKEARDDDLATRFGQLRVQITRPDMPDPSNWLGIYRNALKLADLIRPIRTQDEAKSTLSEGDAKLVNENLLEICTDARKICEQWRERLGREPLRQMHSRLEQKIDSLEFEMLEKDGHLFATLPANTQSELIEWMNERAEVFSSHYFESLELALATKYREALTPVRRKVAQFALRRPRIIRSEHLDFKFSELPSMEASGLALHQTSLKERLLERRIKREKSDAVRRACRQKLHEYLNLELARLKKGIEVSLNRFESKLITMLDDWLRKTQTRLASVSHLDSNKHRPTTVGRRLEKDIIPALMERIEHLEH